ncbi:unnamed protein product [Linum tenue]|uniref:Uncharacterized protein n=1 Tax=Linum tenue TaxID=586396 RepID=A0AAV0QK28_9ROSI|nr:unnamed protein product [Linum tenue]
MANQIDQSNPKAEEVVVVVMMVEVVGFPVDQALDAPELLHVAGYGDRPLLVVEIELLLRRFQQPHEQWVVDVDHRDHEPLLLLPFLSDDDRHHPLLRPAAVVVEQIQVREVDVEVVVVVLPPSSTSAAAAAVVVGSCGWHRVNNSLLRRYATAPHNKQTKQKIGTGLAENGIWKRRQGIIRRRRKARDRRKRWRG